MGYVPRNKRHPRNDGVFYCLRGLFGSLCAGTFGIFWLFVLCLSPYLPFFLFLLSFPLQHICIFVGGGGSIYMVA